MTDQLGRYETYTYYRNAEITPSTGDNLKSYTDRKGQTTTFNQYDPVNRLKQVSFGAGSSIQYTYDAVGRVTNILDSVSGEIGYTYQDNGCPSCSGGVNQISQETTPYSTIDYTYDANGRRATMTVSGEPVVTYGYDDAGRLSGITRNVGGVPRTYNLGYDGAGRRASVQIPLANGVDSVVTAYGYDIANRLTGMLIQGGTAQIDNLTYSYDPNGNRTNFTRNTTLPLPPAVSGTSHDTANQMLAFNGKNLTYDANGNLQSRTDVCGATTFTWDARNRLTAINGYKPDCTALTASFSYDAVNRRIAKTINGITTQFVYDVWDVTQEITSGVKTNYVRTLNIDVPLTRITGSTIRHYVKDALGSTVALTDDSGAVKTTYTYDAYGNATATGETSDNPFQYTARENDGTGLYYYRARYYSPEMQRLISEDPIRLNGGDINFFAYTHNNPIRYIDPLGLYDISFSTGFHIPVSPGVAVGPDVSSSIKNYSDNPGNSIVANPIETDVAVGVIADAGVAVGISDLSGTRGKCAGYKINLGAGRYAGAQFTLRQSQDTSKSIFNPLRYIDGLSIGLGVGIASPVSISRGL
jgi:RHS repeat-associated protein